ncbi:hypothetical protein T09_14120 [Trichinella sp. T9]|nr:hypothetical protein T09_14120 [Trichinella sp. T9]
MRRKENPLGWALPQQSIKGLNMVKMSAGSVQAVNADSTFIYL